MAKSDTSGGKFSLPQTWFPWHRLVRLHNLCLVLPCHQICHLLTCKLFETLVKYQQNFVFAETQIGFCILYL